MGLCKPVNFTKLKIEKFMDCAFYGVNRIYFKNKGNEMHYFQLYLATKSGRK